MFRLECRNCGRETSSTKGGLCRRCIEAVEEAKAAAPVPPVPTEGWVRETPEGEEGEDFYGCEEWGLVLFTHPDGWFQYRCVLCGLDRDSVYEPQAEAVGEALIRQREM